MNATKQRRVRTLSHNHRDHIGEVHGSWTIIGVMRERRRTHILFRCRCRCGRVQGVSWGSLYKGLSAQCRKCAASKRSRVAAFRRARIVEIDGRRVLGWRHGWPTFACVLCGKPTVGRRCVSHGPIKDGGLRPAATKLGISSQAVHIQVSKRGVAGAAKFYLDRDGIDVADELNGYQPRAKR